MSLYYISLALETLLLGMGHNFIQYWHFQLTLPVNYICNSKGSKWKFAYILEEEEEEEEEEKEEEKEEEEKEEEEEEEKEEE